MRAGAVRAAAAARRPEMRPRRGGLFVTRARPRRRSVCGSLEAEGARVSPARDHRIDRRRRGAARRRVSRRSKLRMVGLPSVNGVTMSYAGSPPGASRGPPSGAVAWRDGPATRRRGGAGVRPDVVREKPGGGLVARLLTNCGRATGLVPRAAKSEDILVTELEQASAGGSSPCPVYVKRRVERDSGRLSTPRRRCPAVTSRARRPPEISTSVLREERRALLSGVTFASPVPHPGHAVRVRSRHR